MLASQRLGFAKLRAIYSDLINFNVILTAPEHNLPYLDLYFALSYIA